MCSLSRLLSRPYSKVSGDFTQFVLKYSSCINASSRVLVEDNAVSLNTFEVRTLQVVLREFKFML